MIKSTIREDGECFIVEIPLGSVIEERSLAIIHFVVMCVGLLIVTPDVQLMRFQTGFDLAFTIAQSVIFVCWIGVGLFACSRFLYAPYPVVLTFSPNAISYDSGKAGLSYLCRIYEEQVGPLYRRAFERRKIWRLYRAAIHNHQISVTLTADRMQINDIDRTLDLGFGIPEPLQKMVRNAILAWVKAEPNDAPKSAVGCFEMERFSPPTG